MIAIVTAIDWDLCLQRSGGSQEAATEMLAAIVDELPSHRLELEAALRQQDYRVICQVAHKINGMCCYSGLPLLKQATVAYEQEFHRGKFERLADLTQSLLETLDQAIDTYRQRFTQA